ncbi:AraC family transcriptional regulator [Stenotrophomonas maltophilia]|uniref:AraC family transcriptional regulator n=1 Tax=Stenotrophomonas maltophilia TaxID=40324 RepID=UPI000B4C5897|nr:AraC family transcriptional regulator [Stenotrophomonas maltophilia]OWQ65530.1 AraC family transcriptional regulator [Stenotrophomonas maltophilia]QGL69544.1 AraC family transcriptional regulator [Stenotrophomonas maltophilia]
MSAAGKALWYIETHADQPLALADIAAAAGLSPFHLSRLFQARTGTSVVRYLRGRRLTAAAQRLADGAGDILQVALGAGYTTHAAFTRAFNEQFGQTPERVREQGTDGLALVQAIRVDDAPAPCGEAPRLLDTPAFQVAGIGMRHTRDSGGAIPGQWAQLNREWPTPAPISFGVCCNSDDDGGFDYIAALPASAVPSVPAHWRRVDIPARRYLVAWHGGHISAIRSTWFWLLDHYLPGSGLSLANAPDLERYDTRFDEHTGNGGVEIWLPVDERPR